MDYGLKATYDLLATKAAAGGSSTQAFSCSNLVASGTVSATKVYNAVYNDLAELFECDNPSEYSPGDIVIFNNKSVSLPEKELDNRVVGVYSDTYGQLLGGEQRIDIEGYTNFIPIGISGRVRIKIEGEFKTGDLIVASGNKGYGCASLSYKPGTVVGKVLEDKVDDDGRAWCLIMNI